MSRTPKTDVDIFFSIPKTVKTVGGDDVEIPRMSWRREQGLLPILGRLLQRFPIDRFIDEEKQEVHFGALISTLIDVLPEVLGDAIDILTDGVAYILQKDVDWVLDNLEMEGVLSVAIPFYTNCILKGKRVYDRFAPKAEMPLLEEQFETLSPSSSPTE